MTLYIPETDKACPRRGNTLTAAIGRLMLRSVGWNIAGNFPAEPKFVIAFAPHTSYQDWYVGMGCLLAFRLQSSWMTADGFFWWPLSWLFRQLGGVPIKRDRSHNVVAQMVDRFNSRDKFVLIVAPEGNRQKVEKWKTGFYHIAHGAKVPIFFVALDYDSKTLRLGPTFAATGNADYDIKEIRAHFKKFKARYPVQS